MSQENLSFVIMPNSRFHTRWKREKKGGWICVYLTLRDKKFFQEVKGSSLISILKQ